MDGFCNHNADQLGSLAGPSLLTVYVGVVECAPASPYTYPTSTHRFPDERTHRGYASFSDICGAWFGFGSGFGIGLTLTLLLARAPLLLSTLLSHTIPFPPRSLVCGGQPSPHKPRLVVSHSTCPPLSSSPHAHSFVLSTAVINNNNAADGTHGAGLRGKRWRGQGVAETLYFLLPAPQGQASRPGPCTDNRACDIRHAVKGAAWRRDGRDTCMYMGLRGGERRFRV